MIQDHADAVADLLAAEWEANRHADAAEICDWILDADDAHPAILTKEAASWDEWDWRVIGNEVGLPTPPATQALVISMLAERAA